MPRTSAPAIAILVALLSAVPAAARDASAPPPPEAALTPAISAQEFLTHAARLASDGMSGRESGTAGGRAAEEYVARELLAAGLEAFGDDGTPFVDVSLPMRPMKPEDTKLALSVGTAEPEELGTPTDVLPFSFSENARVTGQVVFCGYGLVDDENGWNDYAGVDVKGKIVLALRHGPRETDADSPWTMTRRARPAQQMRLAFTTKAQNAADAGALALLLVNDRHHGDEPLPVRVPGERQSIPVVAVSRDVANRLVAPLEETIEGLQIALDAGSGPASRAIGGTSVTVTSKLGETLGRNVLALRRGSDPVLSKECIVVCAHLDHVGTGKFGSTGGNEARGQIHNGADDNASGTAALLEIAAYLAARPAPKRSILFAAWCGEEMGLVGSRSYVAAPRWPLADTAACLNVDMLGRYRADAASDRGLMLEGADTGSTLRAVAEKAASDAGLRFTHARDGWEQSDHYSFYAADVPSLFFTTGLHAQYHKPDDDWWLLVGDGAAASARAIAEVALTLASAPTRPAFAKLPPQPVLGVRLMTAEDAPGATIAFLAPDFAAARAGLQIGDRIVAWNGTQIASDDQLHSMIGSQKPGDVVSIRFYRGEVLMEAQATLTAR